MNSRIFIMFIFALLLAAGAASMAYRWVQSQSAALSAGAKSETVPVVAAAVSIPFAKKLEERDLKVVNWPKDSVPADHFADPKPVVGMIVTRSMVEGELLNSQRVKEHIGGSSLSALIKEGMRAITVRVDDVAGVAGFIMPGNAVDMIATSSEGGSYTLLQNVNVLAIDQDASPEKDKPTVVRALTLEVSPEQAETLVRGSRSGPLHFTLRNPLDSVEAQPATPKADKPTQEEIKPTPIVQPKGRTGVRVYDWDSEAPRLCADQSC